MSLYSRYIYLFINWYFKNILVSSFEYDEAVVYCYSINGSYETELVPTGSVILAAGKGDECPVSISLHLNSNPHIISETFNATWDITYFPGKENILLMESLQFGIFKQDDTIYNVTIYDSNLNICDYDSNCDLFSSGTNNLKSLSYYVNFSASSNEAQFTLEKNDIIAFKFPGKYKVYAHFVLPTINKTLRYDFIYYSSFLVKNETKNGLLAGPWIIGYVTAGFIVIAGIIVIISIRIRRKKKLLERIMIPDEPYGRNTFDFTSPKILNNEIGCTFSEDQWTVESSDEGDIPKAINLNSIIDIKKDQLEEQNCYFKPSRKSLVNPSFEKINGNSDVIISRIQSDMTKRFLETDYCERTSNDFNDPFSESENGSTEIEI